MPGLEYRERFYKLYEGLSAQALGFVPGMTPFWNIPQRAPFFTGRDELLADMEEALTSNLTVGLAQPLLLEGLAGIGKTATAIEYAYRRRDWYQVALWVNAETPEQLTADFLSLAELAAGGELRCSARFESELVFSSGAYAAVVEIERSTGRLRVRRIAAVDDAGNVINPLLAHGQVIGGLVQALGECLTEEAAYDPDGTPRFSSLMDYSLLTAAEVPEICTGEVNSPSPLNPLGSKGVGEAGAIGTLAAVANAVVDALGGRHLDPPFHTERLWRALQ